MNYCSAAMKIILCMDVFRKSSYSAQNMPAIEILKSEEEERKTNSWALLMRKWQRLYCFQLFLTLIGSQNNSVAWFRMINVWFDLRGVFLMIESCLFYTCKLKNQLDLNAGTNFWSITVSLHIRASLKKTMFCLPTQEFY